MTADENEPAQPRIDPRPGETMGELYDRLPEGGAWISIPELGVELRNFDDGGLEMRRTDRDDEEGPLP